MMVENQPERRIGNGHRLTLPIMRTRRQIKSTSEQPVHSVQPLSLSAPPPTLVACQRSYSACRMFVNVKFVFFPFQTVQPACRDLNDW
jgi:hypothetical protein